LLMHSALVDNTKRVLMHTALFGTSKRLLMHTALVDALRAC